MQRSYAILLKRIVNFRTRDSFVEKFNRHTDEACTRTRENTQSTYIHIYNISVCDWDRVKARWKREKVSDASCSRLKYSSEINRADLQFRSVCTARTSRNKLSATSFYMKLSPPLRCPSVFLFFAPSFSSFFHFVA